MARQPPPLPVGHGLLIDEVSRSHSDTPQSVGLLWASNRPVAETSDNTQQKHIHARGEVRTRNPGRRTAADRVFVKYL